MKIIVQVDVEYLVLRDVNMGVLMDAKTDVKMGVLEPVKDLA